MIKHILHDYNVFVDGVGYAGQTEDMQLPDIKAIMAEYGGGGMAGTIEIPMGKIEKMTTSFTLKAVSPEMFGKQSITMGKNIPITARGVLQDENGKKHAVIARMRGKLMVEKSSWKAGEPATLKINQAVDFYQLSIDGIEREYADPVNMVIRFDGEDQLTAERAILGV